jgi:hypothetical protein
MMKSLVEGGESLPLSPLFLTGELEKSSTGIVLGRETLVAVRVAVSTLATGSFPFPFLLLFGLHGPGEGSRARFFP